MNKILTIILALFVSAVSAMAQVETRWISRAVVPGEKTILLVIMTNGTIAESYPLPKVEGASIRFAGSNYLRWPTAPGQRAYYLAFEVLADKPGNITIPPISLRADNGSTYQTHPQTLIVYPYDAIKWQPLPQSDDRYQYGVLWHMETQSPYVNEPSPCELKFYAPDVVTNYQIPNIKTNGIAAWQFEPTLAEMNIRPMGTAFVKRRNWQVMTFHSALTPIRAGKVTASGEVVAYAVQEDDDRILAQFSRNLIPIPLPIPPLEFTAKALPAGAPASFSNAVGQFKISTKTQALDLSANEPVSVQITVEGSGNIDLLNCPEPKDASQWKIYPPNKLTSPETRTLRGKTVFQRLMRPTAETTSIPPFELTYFDPSDQKYKTISSAAIPLPWKTTASASIPAEGLIPAVPPPAGITPVEKMTDIYGNIPESVIYSLREPSSNWWYLLAYIPGLLILVSVICRYFKRKRELSVESRARLTAANAISTKLGGNDFLRAAGSFIEANIPESYRDDMIRDILHTRDAQAFLPESSGNDLPASKKSAMIKHIKQVLHKIPLILFGSLVFGLSSWQADAGESLVRAQNAYSKGEYSLASAEFTKETADKNLPPQLRSAAYFGLGNSLYRLNKPGEAALNYRRALLITPGFTEASKNLAFIERKEGALLPANTGALEWLTYLPYDRLLPIILVSGAIFLAAIALLTASRKWTVLISVIATLSFLAILASTVNKLMYPSTPSSISPEHLLIATETTPARPSADTDSPALLSLPPSTPLIELAKRGSWYYVRTFSGTPAWVHQSTVSPVILPAHK